jgi:hypothetical protein
MAMKKRTKASQTDVVLQAEETGVDTTKRKRGVATLHAVPSRTLIEIASVEEIEGDAVGGFFVRGVPVLGAFLKVSPVIKSSKRSDFDAATVRVACLAFGAVAVIVAPKIVADSAIESSSAIAKAPTTRAAVEAWFAEIRGLQEVDRASAKMLAESLLEAEGV